MQWDLVCDQSSKLELSIMLINLGTLLGACLGTFLGDVFGRKPVFALTTLFAGLLGLASAFIPNYPVYTTFVFLRGICCGVNAN